MVSGGAQRVPHCARPVQSRPSLRVPGADCNRTRALTARKIVTRLGFFLPTAPVAGLACHRVVIDTPGVPSDAKTQRSPGSVVSKTALIATVFAALQQELCGVW